MSRPSEPAGPLVARRAVLAAGCALVPWALAGCAGLPAGGSVQPGRALDEKVAGGARIVAPPPEPGATPEQIVRGFLRAGAAFQEPGANGELVAKAYLAPDSVPRWLPTSAVTVFDSSTIIELTQMGPDTIRAATTAVAIVDDTGHYRELAPGTRHEVALRLVQIEGEWRIELPAAGFGIWVNTNDFDRIFQPYQLSYPVVGSRRLLSDVRWWPSGPRLVTALARAQVSAPPDYLKGVVDTGFPETVRLAREAVTVLDGVATVVLTSPASAADVAHRRAMWAQLVATLLAVPEVAQVSIEVQAGGRLAVPDLPERVLALSDTGFVREAAPLPRTGILRTGEVLTRVELARLDDVPGPAGVPGAELPTIATHLVGLAAGPDGIDLAAVNVDGTSLQRWRGKSRLPVEIAGTGLTHPAYDPFGYLWVAGRATTPDGGGALWSLPASTPTGTPGQRVAVTWLGDRVPGAIAPSRDGTRMAIVSLARDGTDPQVHIAGIVRDAVGAPVSVAMPMAVDAPFRRVQDVTWIDDVTLGVLATVGLDPGLRVYVAELGQGIGLRRRGAADPAAGLVTPVPEARSVVATVGVRGLVVSAAGGVLVRVGNGWRAVGQANELAVVPARPSGV